VSSKANYGNWVPQGIVFLSLAASVLLFIPTLFLDHSLAKGILYVASALCLLFFLYLQYVYYLLGRDGGQIQEQFYRLILGKLPWQGHGRALDIGTGNGALAIELARAFPTAEVVGVDLWGKPWTYAQEACERNAALEGVADRVSFIRTGAESLAFDDEYFDAVVSNFVFHSIPTHERLALLREALRVLKVGGHFAFQDLFNDQFYHDPENLDRELQSWGLHDVHLVMSEAHIQVPRALQLKHMLGGSAVLFGTK